MSTDAILDALALVKSEDATVSGYGNLFLKSIGKSVEPGFLTFMRKRKSGSKNKKLKMKLIEIKEHLLIHYGQKIIKVLI